MKWESKWYVNVSFISINIYFTTQNRDCPKAAGDRSISNRMVHLKIKWFIKLYGAFNKEERNTLQLKK